MDREKAVKSAMASLEMEGFVYTEAEKEIFNKLAKGEISTDDVRKMAAELIERWKKERPESFVKE